MSTTIHVYSTGYEMASIRALQDVSSALLDNIRIASHVRLPEMRLGFAMNHKDKPGQLYQNNFVFGKVLDTPSFFGLLGSSVGGSIRRVAAGDLEAESISSNARLGRMRGLEDFMLSSVNATHSMWSVSVSGGLIERDLMLWVVSASLAKLSEGVVDSDEVVAAWIKPLPSRWDEFIRRLDVSRLSGNELTAARQYLEQLAATVD